MLILPHISYGTNGSVSFYLLLVSLDVEIKTTGSTGSFDFERLSKIHSLIDVPIVMHGGSGVSAEDYREVIKRGVRKVNYYTYMAKAGGDAISNKTYSQFHDALLDAEKAMRDNVKKAISVFSGL